MLCPNCGKEVPEGTAFCTQCGTPVGGAAQTQQSAPQGQPVYQQAPYVDFSDHTAEFNPKDISDNKVIAMLPYLMGTIGVLIAIIAAKESPFVSFHVREALKFTVCEVLLAIVTAVLFWTIIVPIVAGVCFVVLFVCRIIAFVRICSGKAKEAPIIKGFGFLK